MPKSRRKRAKPAETPPPPPSLAELIETSRRIRAQTHETIRKLVALQEEFRIARARFDERKQP